MHFAPTCALSVLEVVITLCWLLIFTTWFLVNLMVFASTVCEQIKTPFCNHWVVSVQQSHLIGLNRTSPAPCLKSHTNALVYLDIHKVPCISIHPLKVSDNLSINTPYHGRTQSLLESSLKQTASRRPKNNINKGLYIYIFLNPKLNIPQSSIIKNGRNMV